MMKLKVYVHSLKIPTVGFVDKEGAMHACAQAQRTAFERLSTFSNIFQNRCLTDDDRELLTKAEAFCRDNELELEVIDLGILSVFGRLKTRINGLRAPAICCEKRVFHGIPTENDLKGLVKIA
jgi:hypothetical protein